MLHSLRRFLVAGAMLIAGVLSLNLDAAPPSRLSAVTVRTRAPQNRLVTVWYRVPKDYHSRQPRMSRVLVLFGGRNDSGKNMASGALGWGEWADANNAFLVSPGCLHGILS